MLDKNFVRDNLDFVRERLAARGGDFPLEELVAKDAEWKGIIRRSEELRRTRNEESEAIGKLKRKGEDTSAQQAKVKEISGEIKSLEEAAGAVDAQVIDVYGIVAGSQRYGIEAGGFRVNLRDTHFF